MIMACLAAITIVIKAERNDGGSPKGMAGISNKRLKQYSAGASEQHEGCDGTLLGVRGVPPKEMLLQNQRESTVSTEIASELSRIWLGSEKLARKHWLVLNERGMWAAHLRRGQSFCCVHLCNIGSDSSPYTVVLKEPRCFSLVKGRCAL